jgi:hypothetical protein
MSSQNRSRTFFCFSLAITRVIAREKQREQLGSGAIADGETRAKNATGNGPLEWKRWTFFVTLRMDL